MGAKSEIANDFLTRGPVLCSLGSDELYKPLANSDKPCSAAQLVFKNVTVD